MADIKEVSTNVKDLIFAYERQTSSTESLEHYEGRRRAKSIGNALSYKLFRQSNLEIHHLVDIEKELVKIEAHLNYYEVYEKDTQVAFQEQLLNVLTYIVNIDPEGDEDYKQKKKELIAETQKLFKILTSKLPVYRVHSYRSLQRTASRREEAIVSSTSVRSHERRAISSGQLAGAFKSEESLEYSNKDSSSVDLNTTEERPESVTPPPPPQINITTETSYIPSVSKLKKFFSFRRDDIKVTPNSGVSRSQSLNIKTNNYTVFKKEVKKREEVLNENDEEGEFNKHEVLSSTHINTNDDNLYVEPVEEIKEYREIQNEQAHIVSVSKLKSLFEDKQKETEEGHYMNFTGLLRNIDIQKKVDLNKSKSMTDLKTTNLQYDLKEIDIDDLSKEVDDDADDFEHVSIDADKDDEELNNNELHEASLGQQITHTSEETTQSNATFVIGNVKTLKKTFESHGSFDLVDAKKEIHRIIEPIQHTTDGESVLKIPIQLRTGFGQVNHSNEVVKNHTTVDDGNADIKHILHRTIDPIPHPNSNLQEPVLKVPIQLRTGFSHMSHEQTNESVKSELVEEPVLKIPVQLRVGLRNYEDHAIAQSNEKLVEETVASGTVEALKQTFETRNSSSEVKFETLPKLPHSEKPEIGVTEIGTNFIHVSRSEKETLNGNVTKDEKEDFTLHGTINPNVHESVGAPIMLRTNYTQINNDSAENGTNVVDPNVDIKHTLHRTIDPIPHPNSSLQEPVLKVPIQFRTGFSHIGHDKEEVIEPKNESVQEPVLRIPVQLRLGMGNVEDHVIAQSNDKLVEESVASGTVEALKQTFETRSLSSEFKLEISPKLPHSEKPELRVSEMGTDFVHVSGSEKEFVNGTVTLHSTFNPSIEKPVEVQRGLTHMNNDSEGTINLMRNDVAENATIIVNQESVTSGTVEALKQTFENISTKTEGTREDVNSIEPVLKVPIHLREFAVDNHNAEEHVDETTNNLEQELVQLSNSENITTSENEVEELNITSGTVEALKQTFEHLSTTLEASSEDIKHVLHRTVEPIQNSVNSNDEAVLKVPIQLRTFENNSNEYTVTEAPEENSIVEQQINGGVMNILESPTTAYSTILSSSSSHSHSQQVSSSSKVSVSYSQKTSVQRTSSSQVSHKRITSSSSSSSGLLSQKYFEILKNSSSPTTEESTVTIKEVEDQETPKYKLNISRENLLDEILNDTDLDNVDEDFEKLLENTN